MTDRPSAQDSARQVLSIFQHHTLKSGQGLAVRSFRLPFDEPGWQVSDRETGLRRALENGWIQHGAGDFFVLTDAGFTEFERGA
jgi:hypothetical protein